MVTRGTPTPDPRIAGDFGARALQAAIFFGLIFPILQNILWMILVDIPASSDVLSQPSHAWLYIGLLGILPPLAFVLAVTKAATDAGVAGGVSYLMMWLVTQQFFDQPILTVWILIGLVIGVFVFFAVKTISNQGRRGGHHGKPPLR